MSNEPSFFLMKIKITTEVNIRRLDQEPELLCMSPKVYHETKLSIKFHVSDTTLGDLKVIWNFKGPYFIPGAS